MPKPHYQPAPIHLQLGSAFYDPVRPAEFPQHILRYRNDVAAADIGLQGLSDVDFIRHFGQFEPLADNIPEPLALRYHGHQFGVYNPEIGDGRGFYLRNAPQQPMGVFWIWGPRDPGAPLMHAQPMAV